MSMMAPSIVVAGTNWSAVTNVSAQVYGYMQQDGTLQRIPMTTWRRLSTTEPTHFNFNRKHIMRHIYAGGFVPISNINGDLIVGVHAFWNSGSQNSSAELKMKLDVNCRILFKYSSDIQIGEVLSTS